MKIALLGLPQAGKRTLFALLTRRRVNGAVRPGELIEGVAAIRDPRVDTLSQICKPRRTIYAENRTVLCPDADLSSGSRDWLDAARRCELLCLVVRGFASDEIYHPAGSVDAERDSRALRTELLLADLERIERRLDRLRRERAQGFTPEQQIEQEALELCLAGLEREERVADLPLLPYQLAALRGHQLLTLKPLLEIHNLSEAEVGRPVAEGILAVSAQIEAEITGIDSPGERAELIDAMGLAASGLDRVNAAAYAALGLMSFYTIGEDEVRAWTIRRGSTAPVAGGKIHSDIARGFIRVEVIKYDDLVAAGSEKAARDQGKLQTKGRDYVMEDGDICHFLFNV
jgi:GTP-binding protein YchF